jgi:hypothetical protein
MLGYSSITMQKSLRLPILLFLVSLFFGCASTTPTGGQVPGSMVATVNGQSWSSAIVPGVTAGTLAVRVRSTNTLTVTGTSVDLGGHTQTIALVLVNPQPGTQSLGVGNTGSFSYGLPGQDSYVTTSLNAGQVTLTQYDTQNQLVSGTFNFTAHQASNLGNTVTVTNGSFNNVKWRDE